MSYKNRKNLCFNETNKLLEKDRKYIWHPCSQMKDYENLPPIIVDCAKGPYVYSRNGTKYLDIISSWWCNLLGHNHPKINKALKTQIDKFAHVIFANFTHDPAITLCEKLSKLLPKPLEKFFFSSDGSSSIEIALKMSYHYHVNSNPKKKEFIALKNSYHGETLGALSMSSLGIYSSIYDPILLKIKKVLGPDCYKCRFDKNRNSCSAECIKDIEEEFENNGNKISGVFVEPLLQAASGMKIYPPVYLNKLSKLTKKYKIHLIFDEIATGFGRTGKMFALDHTETIPDIICLSKGLSGGYLPIALTVTNNEIYNSFYDDYEKNKAFLHSHTHSGNALASSVSNAVIDVLLEKNIIAKANKKSKYFNDLIKDKFNNSDISKYIGEIRNIGLINAIEFEFNNFKFTKHKRISWEIYKEALNLGLILRPLGNVIYFNPPLTITKTQMNEAVNKSLLAALKVLK